jgi:membrane-bound lytic murein transglycosylase MltF
MIAKFYKYKILLTILIILLFNLILCIDIIAFEYNININDYDQYFNEYTKKFFGSDFDWRYFKAQAIAESRLSPIARSDNGAVGLMQILPSTFDELKSKNSNIRGSITDPRSNIAAGIYYNSILWAEWAKDRSFDDRLNFMFGSYNAGKHSILKAQQIAMDRGLNPYLWSSIAETLPEVNGERSRETVLYIQRIHDLRGKMKSHKDIMPLENTDN